MLKYDELELEVIRFSAEDIITTSGEGEEPSQPGDCGDSPPCPIEETDEPEA